MKWYLHWFNLTFEISRIRIRIRDPRSGCSDRIRIPTCQNTRIRPDPDPDPKHCILSRKFNTHTSWIMVKLGGESSYPARSARKFFCTPIRFCTFLGWVYMKISKRKYLSPPWIAQGGDIFQDFCCPPPESLRRGTIPRGGTVPPLKRLRGGTVPIVPPLVSALVYICTLYNVHCTMYIVH